MPATINSIGTGYWGKKNVLEMPGICGQCHKEVNLRSYDTNYCFVVLFLPVIPLGKRRVVDHCPACGRHYVFSLKKWRRLKKETLETASEEFRSNPNDPRKALEFINAVISTQDYDLFRQTAKTLERHFAQNPDILLSLGQGHALFENPSEAEEFFRKAIPFDQTNDAKTLLISSLILQKRPGEAIPIMGELLEKPSDQPQILAMSLVRASQSEGLHHEALGLIGKMESATPELAESAEMVKLRKISEKHKQTGKRIAHKDITQAVSGKKETSPIWMSVPVVVPLILFALFLFSSWIAGQRTKIRLVNGLNRSQITSLNGKQYELGPQSDIEIRIGQGEIEVLAFDSRHREIRETCRIATPFWSRLLEDPTYVLNPDRTALLIVEKTLYTSSQVAEAEDSFELFTNRLFYSFDTVDFAFKEFPQEIQLPTGVNSVQRSRLMVFKSPFPGYTMTFLMENLPPEQLSPFLEQKILFEESTPDWLGMYAALTDPNTARPFLEKGLENRPLNIQWHRVYQDFMDRTQPAQDLVPKYRQMLSSEPENADLQYLLARITTDPIQANEQFHRAATGPIPSAYAMNALAFDALGRADFKAGLEWSSKALAKQPDIPGFMHVREGLMLGLGRANVLLDELRESNRVSPIGYSFAETALRYLSFDENPQAPIEVISQYIETLGSSITPSEKAQQRRYLETVDAYSRGDTDTFVKLAQDLEMFAFEAALALNQWQMALDMADTTQTNYGLACLAVSVLADHFGNPGSATQAMERAVSLLQQGNRLDRQLASWLDGTTQPKDPTSISLNLSEKALALLALGQKYPQFRKQCFQLAAKLNLDRKFPFLTVNRVLEGQ